MTSPRTYKTTGIVLRARNLGEADKIITFFTEDRGKIDAVAKGVRRQRSHLAGRFEFMSEASMSLHRGRNLDIITSADIRHSHFNVVVKPTAFAAASVMAELIDALCEVEMAVPHVYELLGGALAAFHVVDDPLALLPRFQLRMLDALGLGPPSNACVRCGVSLEGAPGWLDVESGGLAGNECRQTWMNVIDLDVADVENFQALSTPKGSGRPAAVLARPAVARAIELAVSYQLGRRPRSGAHAREFSVPHA